MRLYVFDTRLLVALGALVISLPAPDARAEQRVLVELFTSQGCSSCPAADKLLGELAKDPSVLTMSLSVDYWDYLGWKDTLALPGHAKRQRAYAGAREMRIPDDLRAAIEAEVPILTSVSPALSKAWAEFAGPSFCVLSADLVRIDGWRRSLPLRTTENH